MRYPNFLKDNGIIGFIAPSFGCNIEPYRTAFDHAQETFASKGYKLNPGPNCYEGKGIGISNTPKLCGQEFTNAYCGNESDILLSCGGGELMCEILDHVDWEKVKQASPKWFMGYSDNTNLTFLLTTMCDTASVYGPCAPAFGMEPWYRNLTDAMDLLTGKKQEVKGYELWEKESLKDEEHPTVPYHLTEKKELRIFAGETELPEGKSVTVSGRLIGGCMDCLVNLLGTKYDHVSEFQARYQTDGLLWFLESCDLNVMAIRRAMWQMEHAGWFEQVKGFVIGRPLCFGQEMMGLDQYKAVCDIVAHHGVPVIMDADLGHLPPAMPLVCGSMAEIAADREHIWVKMKYQ